MKIYGNCPNCNHDDRYLALLPDNEDGMVIYKCHKCDYEETSFVTGFDDACEIDE